MVPMLLYKKSTCPALHILNYVRDLRQRQEQQELKMFRQQMIAKLEEKQNSQVDN